MEIQRVCLFSSFPHNSASESSLFYMLCVRWFVLNTHTLTHTHSHTLTHTHIYTTLSRISRDSYLLLPFPAFACEFSFSSFSSPIADGTRNRAPVCISATHTHTHTHTVNTHTHTHTHTHARRLPPDKGRLSFFVLLSPSAFLPSDALCCPPRRPLTPQCPLLTAPPSFRHSTQAQSLVKKHGEGDMALRLLLSECKVLLRTQAAAAAARRASAYQSSTSVQERLADERPSQCKTRWRPRATAALTTLRSPFPWPSPACDFQTKWARGELNPALRDVFGRRAWRRCARRGFSCAQKCQPQPATLLSARPLLAGKLRDLEIAQCQVQREANSAREVFYDALKATLRDEDRVHSVWCQKSPATLATAFPLH